MAIKRRDFLAGAGSAVGVSAALVSRADTAHLAVAATLSDQSAPTDRQDVSGAVSGKGAHAFNGLYSGEYLERIAFPLGGIGAGMICLEGSGALSKFSLRHTPDLCSEPLMFAALSIKGGMAKVLEGPVPGHKKFAAFSVELRNQIGPDWGLPRFRSASFEARFPFARIALSDPDMPLDVEVTGWSPFEPGQEDDASLPVAALEYEFTNRTRSTLEAVFSFNAGNFMKGQESEGRIRAMSGGFVLEGALKDKPWTAGSFAVSTDDPAVKINHSWFRGAGMYRMVWRDIEKGACYDRAPLTDEVETAAGASLFVPVFLDPGQSKKIVLRLAWYVGASNMKLSGGGMPDANWALNHNSLGAQPAEQCYQPWYANRFATVQDVMASWTERYGDLKARAARFSETLHGSTLPPEVLEAVSANLAILKSPTVLRQVDGRFWAWEGCADNVGSCDGSCTHVWNYAQAVPHLFPRLERTLRETEFGPNQNDAGHQAFRAALPIRPTVHTFYAAADGQLGGIMKIHRDWRISGDTEWLRGLWPKVRASLDYCIRIWDPRRVGWLDEPHHNTYDIEFWGPDSMCTSFYLGALKAATLMGTALSEFVADYEQLLEKGQRRMESELYNGEFFHQQVRWQGLKARYPEDVHGFDKPRFAEELALAASEGPSEQYGAGCLSDGVIGSWMAWACGVEPVLDSRKIASHLRAVHRYNFKSDLTHSACPTFSAHRTTYALGAEGGLLLCTWPRGGKPSIPFTYAFEVWTGIEYQVASHLISIGLTDQGLEIVKACRRRYDGRERNPFSEVEAGHWYARALSSYALLQAFSGARYDAVDKVLYLEPAIKGDFRCFLASATGYGTVGVKDGQPFVEVTSGKIPYREIKYAPY